MHVSPDASSSPAKRPSPPPSKWYNRRVSKTKRSGLCLAGGGITGAMYEVGVLAALEDAFEDFKASEFDVIIGASTGACV
ncbi:MAG: putative acylesterase/phospholipase RssA, partial [Polyangiales bacterium]